MLDKENLEEIAVSNNLNEHNVTSGSHNGFTDEYYLQKPKYIGKHQVKIGEKIALKYKLDDTNSEESALPVVNIITVDGSSQIEIKNSDKSRWAWLATDLGSHQNSIAIYVNIIFKFEDLGEIDSYFIEPYIQSVCAGAKSILGDARERFTVQPGVWHSICGLYIAPKSDAETSYEFRLALPSSCKILVSTNEVRAIADFTAPDRITASTSVMPYVVEPLTNKVAGTPIPFIPLDQVVRNLPIAPHEAVTALINAPAFEYRQDLILAFLHWARITPPMEEAPLPPNISSQNLLATGLWQLKFGPHCSTMLADTDRAALELLTSADNSNPDVTTTSPRNIAVKFQETGRNPSSDDTEFWENVCGLEGFSWWNANIGHDHILEITPSARLSKLSLAVLRASPLLETGLTIAGIEQDADIAGWSRNIRGYPHVARSTNAGRLLNPLDGTTNHSPELSAKICDLPSQDACGKVLDRQFYYAYIVNMMDRGECDFAFDNVENCKTFQSHQDALDFLEGSNGRDLTKPVVLINEISNSSPDFITSAVQNHWSYAGKYAISPFYNEYDNKTGTLESSIREQSFVSRFAPTNFVVSMPVAEFLSTKPGEKIFHPKASVCVAHVNPSFSIAELELRSTKSSYRKLTIDEMESLSSCGRIDLTFIKQLDMNKHWPLDRVVRGFKSNLWTLSQEIRSCARKPTASSLDRIFEKLRKSEDREALSDLKPLLLSISMKPAVFLAMKASSTQTFIEYSKKIAEADAIAINLSTFADEICRKDVNFINPLMDFLATCLSPKDFSVALTFCSALHAGTSDRYVQRIAECVRRYGDPSLMATFLINIAAKSPEKLHKQDLVRRFEPLLRSEYRPFVVSALGADFANSLTDSADPAEVIVRAIREGDVDLLRDTVSNASKMSKIDFLKLLDRLRSLSNELNQHKIDINDIAVPGIYRQPIQTLVAAIFSDTNSIDDLVKSGVLDSKNHINAVARNINGDNRMLNDIVSSMFSTVDADPIKINGASIEDVFNNAAHSVSPRASLSDAKVTVVMSAFNPDIPLMEKAIDSVLGQSHKNIELVIIDDASAPEFADGIQRLGRASELCKIVRVEHNMGPYLGRNLALEHSSSEFVAIQDCDDWAHPDRLRLQVAQLQENQFTRLATCNHIRIDRYGRVQFEMDFSIVGDGTMTSIFRRNIFDEIGPFLKVRSRGDVEMRERIKSYYGLHAIASLPVPLLLCLGDSQTLSQRTASNSSQHLQLLRTNISNRKGLDQLRRSAKGISDLDQLLVPFQVRATGDF